MELGPGAGAGEGGGRGQCCLLTYIGQLLKFGDIGGLGKDR